MNNSKDNVFVVFGDSISYGLYDRKLCGWVSRLRLKLEEYAKNNYVVNLAIPGQNSGDIKERFEVELRNRYNNMDNFVLVFAFGIKDAQIFKNNISYINEFRENVEYIIEISKKYTDDIYFVGLINPDYLRRNDFSEENVDVIDKMLKELSNTNGFKYIEIKNLVKKEELVDGLHPNDDGHEKISSFVFEKLCDNM